MKGAPAGGESMRPERIDMTASSLVMFEPMNMCRDVILHSLLPLALSVTALCAVQLIWL